MAAQAKAAEQPVQSAGPTVAAPTKKAIRPPRLKRYRNWKMIAIELAIASAGFYLFNINTVKKPQIPGILGLLVAFGALWLLYRELNGVKIAGEIISVPSNRIRWLPILSFYRREIRLDSLRRITVAPRWWWFEVAWLSGEFGSEMVVFQSRRQRRRFTRLIERLCPQLVVYRSRSISDV